MVKRLAVFIFSFLSLLLLFPSDSHAQESTFTTSPSLAEINDYLSTVTVTFEGQEFIDNDGLGDYYVCLEQDLCIDDKDIRKGIFEGNIDAIGSAIGGLTEDEADENTIERFKLDDGNSIIVCGDGDSKLKTPKKFHGGGDDAKSCAGDENGQNNDKDYFHAGNVYMLAVYQKTNDLYILRSVAGFYVNHGNPEADISPKTNLTSGGKFTIDLSSPKIRNAGNGNKKDRNNYQIIISGPGMKNDLLSKVGARQLLPGNNERCVSFSEAGGSETIELPLGDAKTLTGNYVIKIREQVNEENELDKCLGGFTYLEFHCKIGGSSTDPSLNVCSEAIIDPDKKDITTMAQLFRDLGLTGGGTALPCSDVEGDLIAGNEDDSFARGAVGRPEDCKTLETAIGPIALDPGNFILGIFNYVLGIAGFAALVLIIYGGYNYMISRGDPEKIKNAREIITAAIIGLLFIIFSFVILQVIAGDILRIPGFNEPEASNETGIDRVDDGTIPGTELPPNP